MAKDLKALMMYVNEVTTRGGGTECEVVTETMGNDDQGNYIDISVDCEEACHGYEEGEWTFKARVREEMVYVQISNETQARLDTYALTLENFSEFIANQQRFHIKEYAEE